MSGAASNRVRPQSSPGSARKVQAASSSVVHIDLYNFEDSRYAGSKYVLTSPRSLEACSRLNLKPVELLHKSLSDVQNEVLPEGIPLESTYALYDSQEAQRLESLRLAREERARIIREDAKKDRAYIAPQVYGVSGGKKSCSHEEEEEKKDEEKPIAAVRGSLERQRTALVTSLAASSAERLSRPRLRTASPEIQTRSPNRPRPRSSGANKPRAKTGSKSCISTKDRKIVELLAARQRQESEFYRERERARVTWTDEREKEAEQRQREESCRRQRLAKPVKPARPHSAGECRSMSHHEKRNTGALGDIFRKERELEERQLRDKRRKEAQERNLAADLADRKEMEQLVARRQEAEVAEAAARRELQQTRQQQSRRAAAVSEQHRRQVRLHELQLDRDQNIVQLRQAVELKQQRAERVASSQRLRKEKELRDRHVVREQKQMQAEASRRELEAAISKYQRELSSYSKTREQEAGRAAEQRRIRSVRERARARENLRAKQRDNKQRLDEDLAEMQHDMAQYLAQKQSRADAVHESKELRAQQSRARAASAERLRWSIREQYGTDSFDKKALRAQLENRMGSGVCSGFKNRSSLAIA